MATTTCPAGHESTTDDYCDTCGAPIGAPTGAAAPTGGEAEVPGTEGGNAPPATAAGPPEAACPSCGEPVAGRFCESCGYDVESGTPAAPPPVTLVLGTDRAHWDRMVGAGEPAFPTVAPTLDFVLTGDRAILGRIRTGAPVDVDLALTGAAADPAVSHNQCVFQRDGATWSVSDAGSSNGTWINDATEPLGPGAVHTLAHGDRILIGAWTSLTVRIDRDPSSTSPAASGAAAPATSGAGPTAPAPSAPTAGAAGPDPSAPDPSTTDPSAGDRSAGAPSAPTSSAPPDPS
jgi:hypothetical protein